MNISIRKRYERFRAWQENPFHYTMNEEESHRCCNCGHEFTGSFCPQCGQKATTGAVNWSSVRENVMEIWGVGTRSMTYTLWQLLLRPGYLIRDYISGRRQVSFPPVKMLLIVAVICTIVASLLGITSSDDVESDEGMKSIVAFIEWYRRNQGWGTLALYSWMMLPTWVLFRYSPRCTAHSLPQGFFIQVLLCTLALIIVTLSDLCTPLVLLIPVYYFIAYYQLFGYGLWGTLWRTSLCGVVTVFILLMFFVGALDMDDMSRKHSAHVKEMALLLFGITDIILLAVGYAISRRTYKRRMKSKTVA